MKQKNSSKSKTFFLIFICLTLLSQINSEILYRPDQYKKQDIIFEAYDGDPNYYLATARYYTQNKITEYLMNQGINLDYDKTCSGLGDIKNFTAYTSLSSLKSITDYKEVYDNSIYYYKKSAKENYIQCSFPTGNFLNTRYTVYQRIIIMDKDKGSKAFTITLGDAKFTGTTAGGYKDILIYITYYDFEGDASDYAYNVTCNGCTGTTTYKSYDVSTIKYGMSGENSPAIALSYNYIHITPVESADLGNGYLSFTGAGICNRDTNPCVYGYTCIGGQCMRCHDACGDCERPKLNILFIFRLFYIYIN